MSHVCMYVIAERKQESFMSTQKDESERARSPEVGRYTGGPIEGWYVTLEVHADIYMTCMEGKHGR